MASPIASTSRNMLTKSSTTSQRRHASIVPDSLQIRSPPKLPYRGPLSKGERVYPMAKASKFDQHVNLLKSAQLAVFLRFQNLTAKEMGNFRADIKAIPGSTLKLTVLRPTMLPPVLRVLGDMPTANLQKELDGSMAVVTSDTIDPTALSAFLRLLKKHAKALNAPAPSQQPAKGSKTPPTMQKVHDRLAVISAILEIRQECDVDGLTKVAAMPDLATLRSQIVGVLQQNAQNVVSTLTSASTGKAQDLLSSLQAASGRQLTQTIDGYRLTLEEQAKSP